MSELKPKLVLLHGGMITAENIAKMFKALTGRDPEVSPEWLERTNKELEGAYAKLNYGPKSATSGMLDDRPLHDRVGHCLAEQTSMLDVWQCQDRANPRLQLFRGLNA